MTTGQKFTTEQYEQAFRTFHAGHIERQTAALETIRTILQFLVFLVIAGIAISVAVTFA